MPFTSTKTRVGVLRGGPSSEYEVSLKTGGAVLKHLPDEYEPVDILISRDRIWHEGGVERSPQNILHRVDVIFNGLHGTYGEDGEVQRLLEHFKIPYTGSGPLSSALAMNKIATKKIYKNHGLKTPFSLNIDSDNISRKAIRNIFEGMPAPFVVKPSSGGSSIGVYIVSSLPELEEAVVAAASYSPQVLIEEFIGGKEATCGVVDDFRGDRHYPLLPIEIRHKKDFFDYEAKYSDDATEEICPGNFSESEKEMIKKMAKEAHKSLGLRHCSRSDFMIHPKRGIYILETNTLPGLTEKSLIPKSLSAIGSTLKEFISHLINKALGKRGKV